MKKKYEAPVFEFDSYELDEFVAKCGNTMPNQNQNNCVIEDFMGLGGTLFTDSNNACDIKDSEFGDDDGNDGYCYHIPTPSIAFFGS